ncbi:hypothetical protein E2C01_050367 [Portunus trituberculatus]|uniref:Uncharacterized protein n=1 Tax=Portunus trituberculatus TaxID=210409 RepID=A0A5B7GGK7_PORTR|nr:hypothetical protein [Portunus trituberculatus]
MSRVMRWKSVKKQVPPPDLPLTSSAMHLNPSPRAAPRRPDPALSKGFNPLNYSPSHWTTSLALENTSGPSTRLPDAAHASFADSSHSRSSTSLPGPS